MDLHIDIETFSSIDLKTSGLYKYTEAIDFEILMVAYAFGNDKIKIVDLSIENFPSNFYEALLNPEITKCAHNANFERICFQALGYDIPAEQWDCTMVHSAYCGFPFSLEKVSQAMKLEEKGKLSTGKALIKYFCNPCKPTKVNGGRTRNYYHHDIEKWEDFKKYCINDVEAEREIHKRLKDYPLPEFERINYIIDQEINDNGVLMDLPMIRNAYEFNARFSEEVKQKVKDLTGIDNPNSPAQLKKWLSDVLGKEVKSIAKDEIIKLLEDTESEAVTKVLGYRQKLSKTSVKKYSAMLNCACESNRSHGLFQFYGANRTGRWSGRLIQLQNLPQNHMKDLELARKIVSSGDYDLATLVYDNIPNILSELIRTSFVAPENHTFCVSDYSAIEARIISWLAGEEWRMEVFRTHGKIYEASASVMFNVPIEEVTKGSDWRQKGKTAELALGYQGSVGAMKAMGGDKLDMSDEAIKMLVTKWRKANPSIVKLWYGVENSVIRTLKTRKRTRYRYVNFDYDGKVLTIELPSGRKLFYQKPHFRKNKFDKMAVAFWGIDQNIRKWASIETYGGKLVENIVQAIARDLLAYDMYQLKKRGFKIVMHVHDEVIAEVLEKESKESLNLMNDILSEEIPWAKGLPLNADGYITPFYKKD